MHSKQGELYASNAEVARLEQHIAHLQDQRARLTQQIAGGELQMEQQRGQLQGVQSLLAHWQHQQQEAAVRVEVCDSHASTEAQHLPQAEEAARAAQERYNAVQREQLVLQQQLQLAETQREHIQRNVQQLDSRRSRLLLEQDNLPRPDTEALTRRSSKLPNWKSSAKNSSSSWRNCRNNCRSPMRRGAASASRRRNWSGNWRRWKRNSPRSSSCSNRLITTRI